MVLLRLHFKNSANFGLPNTALVMKILKNIAKYLIFLAIGAFLFWWVYRDLDIKNLKKGLLETNYFWIVVSLLLGLLSHYSRAIRWKMLIKPLGYNPKVGNIFLSVLVMYMVNLFVPRAGEVARCTILAKYEKIPASKLVGTMIVERIADTLTMLMLAVIIFIINLSVLQKFFDVHPEFGQNIFNLLTLTNIILVVIVIILIFVIVLLFRPDRNGKLYAFIKKIKTNLKEGVKSILKLENKWYFIGHTLFIFLMWLLMLYSVFLAYPPTNHLTIWVGMFTFLMGGLAMLMPVQGGIGPWHFMVMESLFLYGIDKTDGKIFALIAHSATNLIYLVLGLIAMFLFTALNKKVHHRHHAKD
jgi:uncharacterized protein (TIRG00374 family)